MRFLLDPRFRYTSSIDTDIRKRFNRAYPGWNKKPVAKGMARAKLAAIPIKGVARAR